MNLTWKHTSLYYLMCNTKYDYMPRATNVLTISLPYQLSHAVDELTRQTEQTRSELVRQALRDYLVDVHEDRQRFLQAYRKTRKEKFISMEAFRKKYGLV